MDDVPSSVLAISVFVGIVGLVFTVYVMVAVLQACNSVMDYIKRKEAREKAQGNNLP